MSQAFRIETLDRSGRWYLSPGARSIYDLRIRNDSKNAVECSLVVDEPAIVVTGGTDCSVAVAYRDVIVEAGEVRGFEVACSVRSQSEATSTFQVSLSEHPALSVPALPPISLDPGQVGEMVIPIQWNRTKMTYSGTLVTWSGSMSVASTRRNTMLRPRQRIRASA